MFASRGMKPIDLPATRHAYYFADSTWILQPHAHCHLRRTIFYGICSRPYSRASICDDHRPDLLAVSTLFESGSCCLSPFLKPSFPTDASNLGSRLGTGQRGIRVLVLGLPMILAPDGPLEEKHRPNSLTHTPALSPIKRRGGRRGSM